MVNLGIDNRRLLSLDFFRGLIMVLLALEAARLYDHLFEVTDSSIVLQFFHHPWNGLRFWDLIQPAFMFIAGTGMALSLSKQVESGLSWNTSFKKILKRCGWLFFWGVLNYAVRPEGLSFELWNVLTQLSFTLLVAFLIFKWQVEYQLLFSLALLLLTELLYRYSNIPGFDQPFTDQHNFGNYMDLVLMGKINSDGWVAVNCIPTAAHTIWGSIAGKFILNEWDEREKVKYLLVTGIVCLIVGYGMNETITPIIKRISTSSFTIASGGWCLLTLALFYWWIDVKGHRKNISFFTIVGMNSIFIYLFFEIVGARWFNDYVGTITMGLFSLIHLQESISLILTSLIIFSLEWEMCWFLYQKKIFFKV
ncbi:MAG: DUF5009 domain-containing protein [Cyclobacteriaceae bacterium]|nr:DUF5009 domain-containing protein [Cyclobacteriaceae bacterium]